MVTRSRAVILEGGRPPGHVYLPHGEETACYVFLGDGTNTAILPAKAKLNSLQVYVTTQFYPPSWWTAEYNEDSTHVTLADHIFPTGAPSTIYYRIEAQYNYFEFVGDGTNKITLPAKTKLSSLQVFVSTQFYPPSWWTAEQGTDATHVTLFGSHTFPNGAPCTIYYTTEMNLNL